MRYVINSLNTAERIETFDLQKKYHMRVKSTEMRKPRRALNLELDSL